jgi:hypothetical protein
MKTIFRDSHKWFPRTVCETNINCKDVAFIDAVLLHPLLQMGSCLKPTILLENIFPGTVGLMQLPLISTDGWLKVVTPRNEFPNVVGLAHRPCRWNFRAILFKMNLP